MRERVEPGTAEAIASQAVETGVGGRRADIQGLRGLAVLFVVWFHTGSGPSGGFLGVDVFFVISGYVITRRLSRGADTHDSVDLGEFYRRRIRRLLPAMTVMTIVVTVATALLLSPFGPQQRAFRTGGAATVFLANLDLYRTTGYFDRSAALNPFLHTWSLSVEEQVFLLLPLMVAAAVWWGARGRGWRTVAIGLVAVASVLSLLTALVATSGVDLGVEASRRLAFFATPMRLWEFGAGILLALALPAVRGGRRWDLAGAVGLLAVVGCVVVVSAGDRHPGPWTVVLVGATALVLVSGSGGGPVAALLSWRPLTALGDVSYGWYLWHWPALVFCAVLWPGRPALLLLVAAVSLVPAWASHRFLEEPVRTSGWWTPRRTWALGAGCVLVPLVMLVGADRLAQGGWGLEEPLGWYDYPQSFGTSCHLLNRDARNDLGGEACRFGPPAARDTVMVVGDEVANGLSPAVVDAAAARGLATVQHTRAGCPFVLGVVPEGYPDCRDWQQDVLAEVERQRPQVVVLAAQVPRYLRSDGGGRVAGTSGGVGAGSIHPDDWVAGVADTVASLERLGAGVIVVGPVPDFGDSFPRSAVSLVRPAVPVPVLGRGQVESAAEPVWRAMDEVIAGDGVEVINPLERLCEAQACSAVADGAWTHLGPIDLTATGARRVRPELDRAMSRLLSP